MTELREDPLSGRPVYVAGGRQARPNLPRTDCPFCPGGLEAPDDYDVRWFVNRWPAMPDDRCEVVLYSPRHDAAFWELGVDGAQKVVALWAERTAALGGRDDISYVLPFENRGPEVGATIPHPHGQIYAFDMVPPAARDELERHGCALCVPPDGDLVVSDHGGARVVSPVAPSWPFELLISTTAHHGDLVDARADHRAFAAALVDGLRRLDLLFDAPMPYMLWVHQRPTDGRPWPDAHVHAHVAPLHRAAGVPRFVAAGELGSGVFYNPIPPDEAASRLRDVGGDE